MHSGLLGAALLVVVSVTACVREPAPQTPGKARGSLSVHVVNYPLRYFAERIGGDDVRVEFPVPRGGDPAFWNPSPEDVVEFQQSDVILLNGAGYARWTGKVSLPQAKLVNTSAGFADQYIEVEDAVRHTHGPEGEHSHAGTAFTTWLEPTLAAAQARAVKEALVKLRPSRETAFQERLEALERDLSDLDQRFQRAVAADPERPLVASHPVYQYFARRYRLNLKSLHWEPDEMPDENMWRELETLLASHPAKWMLWEGPPRDDTVARLEKLGLHSTVIAPCGNLPETGDYLDVQRENARNLQEAFSG